MECDYEKHKNDSGKAVQADEVVKEAFYKKAKDQYKKVITSFPDQNPLGRIRIVKI